MPLSKQARDLEHLLYNSLRFVFLYCKSIRAVKCHRNFSAVNESSNGMVSIKGCAALYMQMTLFTVRFGLHLSCLTRASLTTNLVKCEFCAGHSLLFDEGGQSW